MSKGKNLKKYRNTNDFRVDDLETIDSGSLWTLVNGKLVLVDDDRFVQTDLDLNLFEIAD